jgi:hypothetical protein
VAARARDVEGMDRRCVDIGGGGACRNGSKQQCCSSLTNALSSWDYNFGAFHPA